MDLRGAVLNRPSADGDSVPFMQVFACVCARVCQPGCAGGAGFERTGTGSLWARWKQEARMEPLFDCWDKCVIVAAISCVWLCFAVRQAADRACA